YRNVAARPGVDARVLDGVMPPAVRYDVTRPELANDLDGLGQHADAHVSGGPPVTEDVLVQRLAGAHTGGEPTVGERVRGGGGRLGDDGGMDPRRGTGHPRRDGEVGGRAQAAD